MNEFKMKFLVDGIWISKLIYTKDKDRAKEIGNNMIKRQHGLEYIPVQILISMPKNYSVKEELCEV